MVDCGAQAAAVRESRYHARRCAQSISLTLLCSAGSSACAVALSVIMRASDWATICEAVLSECAICSPERLTHVALKHLLRPLSAPELQAVGLTALEARPAGAPLGQPHDQRAPRDSRFWPRSRPQNASMPAALGALISASPVVGQPSRSGTEPQLVSWRTEMPALSTSLLLTIDGTSRGLREGQEPV